MTFNSLETHTDPVFTQLNILKLQDIYKLKVGLAMRQMIKQDSLATNNISLLTSTHNYSTRSAKNNNCFIPTVRTNIGKSAIKYQGPIVWNSIPSEIKSSSIPCFKKKLSTYYIDKYK